MCIYTFTHESWNTITSKPSISLSRLISLSFSCARVRTISSRPVLQAPQWKKEKWWMHMDWDVRLKCLCAYACVYVRENANHTHTRTQHTYTRTQPLARTHTPSHSHVHMHIHAHMRTHTHTHTHRIGIEINELLCSFRYFFRGWILLQSVDKRTRIESADVLESEKCDAYFFDRLPYIVVSGNVW